MLLIIVFSISSRRRLFSSCISTINITSFVTTILKYRSFTLCLIKSCVLANQHFKNNVVSSESCVYVVRMFTITIYCCIQMKAWKQHLFVTFKAQYR
ncbi:hypothetical protein Tsp_02271 [Trichinella spiralis]|uniref:hypothetical protein n=1 Tax=Trichinella spiralis TaxID=6334 RepID=UPI0001EFCAA2|nr:hypothetical protein Tsp_02271 [Trichinella spiralis]